MAIDEQAVLQASVTKVDTFNSAGYDLVSGTPARGCVAVVNVSSASNTTGNATITYKIQHSADDSTYYDCASGADQIITTSATATPYEICIPFSTKKRYVRLVATFSSTTGTPTATYSGYITFSRP